MPHRPLLDTSSQAEHDPSGLSSGNASFVGANEMEIAGLTPRQRVVMKMQQTRGNAAVLRALAEHQIAPLTQRKLPKTDPRVQRFEGDEHMRIGNTAVPNQTIDLGSEVPPITYGEMVALAGDLFGSIEEITRLANDIYGRDQIIYALWK